MKASELMQWDFHYNYYFQGTYSSLKIFDQNIFLKESKTLLDTETYNTRDLQLRKLM